MFHNTPRLPKQLLHTMQVVERRFERSKTHGNQSRPVDTIISEFKGVILPLSNQDLRLLPEGSIIENTQKLYTDDIVSIRPGDIVFDLRDGQRYTVKTLLDHNTIHPMRRYIVEGVTDK